MHLQVKPKSGVGKAIAALILAVLCLAFALVCTFTAEEADSADYKARQYNSNASEYYSLYSAADSLADKYNYGSYYYKIYRALAEEYYDEYSHYNRLANSYEDDSDVAYTLTIIFSVCATALFIVSLILSIKAIKYFGYAKRTFGTKPIATLILGIIALVTLVSALLFLGVGLAILFDI